MKSKTLVQFTSQFALILYFTSSIADFGTQVPIDLRLILKCEKRIISLNSRESNRFVVYDYFQFATSSRISKNTLDMTYMTYNSTYVEVYDLWLLVSLQLQSIWLFSQLLPSASFLWIIFGFQTKIHIFSYISSPDDDLLYHSWKIKREI